MKFRGIVRMVMVAIMVAACVTVPSSGSAIAVSGDCHAAWKKINWDAGRGLAAADLRVICYQTSADVRMTHPSSSDGPCLGYGTGSSGVAKDFHYSFYPKVAWTPIGTSWSVKYCGDDGSGTVPKYVPSSSGGGGGSW